MKSIQRGGEGESEASLPPRSEEFAHSQVQLHGNPCSKRFTAGGRMLLNTSVANTRSICRTAPKSV